MVPKCYESKNYKIIDHKPTKANNFLEKEIFTRMKVGFPMLKLEYFVRHFVYIQHHKALTWTLDYTKESDFDSGAGTQIKDKGPVFALPFFGNKKKQEEEERLAREAAEKAAMEAQAALEEKKKLFVIRAGFRRYLLVSLVVVLAVYNINTIVAGGFLKEKSA